MYPRFFVIKFSKMFYYRTFFTGREHFPTTFGAGLWDKVVLMALTTIPKLLISRNGSRREYPRTLWERDCKRDACKRRSDRVDSISGSGWGTLDGLDANCDLERENDQLFQVQVSYLASTLTCDDLVHNGLWTL